MSLTAAITSAKRNNEERLAKSLRLPPAELSSDDRVLIERLLMWCCQHGVSQALPLSPAAVATFLEAQSVPDLLPLVAAVEALHDYRSVANPYATTAVRTVLLRRLTIEFPRSWTRADKLLFAALPPEVRSVIWSRETQRDSALRRKQNELSDEIKRLNKTDAVPNSVIQDKGLQT
jgi:hypothetical protein